MRPCLINRSLQMNLCLQLIFDEQSPYVRQKVVQTLVRMRNPSCLPKLFEAMRHEKDGSVISAISDAITKLGYLSNLKPSFPISLSDVNF